ncbi:aromatic-L-amino-acid decarboxylase [Thermosporothrix hazakensis]|jgi:aromatic-L-amino-acid decarboxylase|uniref:Aromatic-L-amino-acid decarboxylase n=1 Tax=Thermosporothrix hazakensis TaxID=644383 RepID=A0A326U2L8_THEHA|nr:pyridoxal-dependent decarboxylase [Thermosporothrix hazakensis]PZW25678.1 aromatic-L-amino-acid decarboxylase [Thermosporothrix hazakensis]GCE48173.1 aromatic-L-amino-acid decarboxylase [Thermosporothrix hazakensis]
MTGERPTSDPLHGDMSSEEFRRYGHQIVDWIADYLDQAGTYPVLSQVAPGSTRQALPQQPPQHGESMDAILEDFQRVVLPGVTHWNSPGFMAYFGITGSGPGILGEMLTSALNVNAMLWRTSPSATELEQLTLDWLRQMLGLPAPLFGVINDTASTGVLYALAAAREAIPHLYIRQKGMAGRHELPPLRLYCSQDTHSSVDKAAITLGIGQEGIRKISIDADFRMKPDELEQAILEDLAQGWLPFAVVATVGTTSTSSIDPIPRIADICERHQLWLHVDTSYAGTAAIIPEFRWILEGCERADSLIVNPHKWLFTPLDCSVLFTRRPDVLKAAFSLVPEYLRNNESATDEVPNLMDYGNALGRRFRALKLWMILRYFGQDGIIARLREHIRLARLLARWIDESPNFERMAPTPFSLVCFRAHPKGMDDLDELNALNERIMNTINARGRFFISHTRLNGAMTLRAAIGNLRTTEAEIREFWQQLQEYATI